MAGIKGKMSAMSPVRRKQMAILGGLVVVVGGIAFGAAMLGAPKKLPPPKAPESTRKAFGAQGEQVLGMVHWEGDFVHALHVIGAAQGQGVGRALLAHAEQAMEAAGQAVARLETDTFNTRSRAFYAALGYREIDSYPDQEWESGLTTLLLEKPLA